MFFADRNFVYLTGLKTSRQAVLLAVKEAEADGSVHEQVYILPFDAYAERWTGARVKPQEAQEISGISDIRFVDAFERDFKALAVSGRYEKLYLEMSVLSMTD